MNKKSAKATEERPEILKIGVPERGDPPASISVINGRDEMNLAEFPFASLRRRGDSRKAITYEGWVTDKSGNRFQQKWTVQGGSLVGLPTEFDERAYVALMAISARHGFKSRKVPFSVYEVLKIMGEGTDKTHYQIVENSLDRLKGVTIKAVGAFWDNEQQELIRTVMAFNLIDKYWLRYRERDEKVREEEGVPGYIVWGEDIWKSIQSGYIKSLDVGFYYSLKNPVARRLYRLLDKRFWGKSDYEFDIFDLASKLGMVRYKFPAEVRKKIQPAITELVSRGFLLSAEPIRTQGYSRLHFVKCPRAPATALPLKKDHDPTQQLPKTPSGTSQAALDQETPVVSALIEIGMATKTAQQLTRTYAAEQIHNWLDAMHWEQGQGKQIKNAAAYVRRALEEDWPLPVHFKTRAQRAEEAAENERKRETYARMLATHEVQEQARRAQEKQQRAERIAQMQTQYQTIPAECEVWQRVLAHIQSEAGFEEVRLWAPATFVLSLRDQIAVIGVWSTVHASQLREQRWLLKKALAAVGQAVNRITLEVPKPAILTLETTDTDEIASASS